VIFVDEATNWRGLLSNGRTESDQGQKSIKSLYTSAVAVNVTATPGTIANLCANGQYARGFIADFERIKENGFEIGNTIGATSLARGLTDKDFEFSGWSHPVIRQVITEIYDLVYVPGWSEEHPGPGGDQPSTQPSKASATAIWLASWCTELHSPSARAGANVRRRRLRRLRLRGILRADWVPETVKGTLPFEPFPIIPVTPLIRYLYTMSPA
jgi:hypothetical protein